MTRAADSVLYAFIATLILPLRLSGQPTARPLQLADAFVVRSAILNEDRKLQVSLPESYSRTTVKYPVLFVLDGSSNILHATASVQFLAHARNQIPEAKSWVNQAGYDLLRRGRMAQAIAFKRNTAWFAESPNAHDSLGDAYCRSGEGEAGRRSYQDSARVAAARTPPSRLTEYQAKAAKGCDP